MDEGVTAQFLKEAAAQNQRNISRQRELLSK